MASHFSEKTFQYFERAHRNRFKKDWFEKNRILYEEHVREPFARIVEKISDELSPDLPRIIIDPKKITRPLRPSNRAEENGFIKNHSHCTIWEKKSSLFEWNPAIHIQFGKKEDDNLYGIGLYMVSSRQMSLMRARLSENYEEFDAIIEDPLFKRSWGGLAGDTYKRFPRGYDAEDERCKYLWHKQFYVGRELSRKQVQSKGLASKIIKDLKVAMPFFKWIRKTVGTYRK
jgi:uncharacterized protein (TIGR02453 family)